MKFHKPIKTLKRLLKILENPNSRLFVGSVSASVFIWQESKLVAWPIKTAMRAINLGLVTEDKSFPVDAALRCLRAARRWFPMGLCYKGIPY